MNRRQFLGAGTAFGLAGCAGFPSILASKSPNAKLRHACIGCGNMAYRDIHSFATHPDIEIAALCDVDSDILAKAAAEFPKARIYRDWRELLAKEGASIDSLNVSVPDHHHTVIASAAMRAGKHVYLQKPLCKTMDEAKRLRELAKSTGVVTQMGAQFIASGADRMTVKALREMKLGPVEHVYFFSTRSGLSRRHRYLPSACAVPENLDWELWLGPAAHRPYAPEVYHPLIWRIWRDLGSGWIGDIGCHLMSAVWMGLELGDLSPLDVVAETETDCEPNVRDLVWPTATHITWTMPPTKVTGGRSIQMEWFDGCDQKGVGAHQAPVKYLPPKEVDALFAKTPYGKRAYEGKAIRCRDGWILQLHQQDTAYLLYNDGRVEPAAELPEAPTHFHEFVNRCLAGEKASADFAWSTHMMELILTGEIAERFPGRKLAWNRAAESFGDPAVDRFLRADYRKGWEI